MSEAEMSLAVVVDVTQGGRGRGEKGTGEKKKQNRVVRTQTGVDEMVSGVKGDRCFDG